MLLATFNVNSVRSRMGILLEWMERHRPEVLALQETKVQDAEFPAEPLRAAGYHVVFRGMKAYNGVALLARAAPRDVAFGLDDRGPADEPRLLRATVDGITFVNTYVPQGRDIEHEMFRYKVEWLGRLRRYFARHFKPTDAVVWLGDCNVAAAPEDVHNPREREDHVCYHLDARRAFQACRDWGFTDLFRQFHAGPGHYSFFDYRTDDPVGRKMGWRIDYLLATAPVAARCRACRIDTGPRLQPKPSDHCPVAAEVD
jgi:exodeoxyribonuclease-3